MLLASIVVAPTVADELKSDPAQLRLLEVQVPPYLFTEVDTPLTVRWRGRNLPGKGTAELTVTIDGRTVVQKTLDPDGTDRRVTVTFRATDPNHRVRPDFVVALRPTARDSGGPRDTLTIPVRIVETKIKVLCVEDARRRQLGPLQELLQKDPRFDARFFLLNGDPKVAQSGPPYLAEYPKFRERLLREKYNVILLGDAPVDFFSNDQREGLREFVDRGGGMVLMAGRQHLPAEYAVMHLKTLLPVALPERPPDPEARAEPFTPELTEAGRRAGWLTLADGAEANRAAWKKLPALSWYYPSVGLVADADVLLAHPRDKAGEDPAPILAVQAVRKGQVAYLATDETWRWRGAPGEPFARLWGALVVELGVHSLLGEQAPRAFVSYDRSKLFVGMQDTFYIRVFDGQHRRATLRKGNVQLVYLEDTRDIRTGVEVVVEFVRQGEYAVRITHERAGQYELRVHNRPTETFRYRVEAAAPKEP
jgi:hypothetical protein